MVERETIQIRHCDKMQGPEYFFQVMDPSEVKQDFIGEAQGTFQWNGEAQVLVKYNKEGCGDLTGIPANIAAEVGIAVHNLPTVDIDFEEVSWIPLDISMPFWLENGEVGVKVFWMFYEVTTTEEFARLYDQSIFSSVEMARKYWNKVDFGLRFAVEEHKLLPEPVLEELGFQKRFTELYDK